VVDDASSDATREVAEAAGAEVLRLKRSLGKGWALRQGILRCRPTLALFVDADLGCWAEEVGLLVAPVREGRADMTVALFQRVVNPGGLGLTRALARAGVRLLAGRCLRGVLSGQRCLRTELVDWECLPRHYGVEVAVTVQVLRRGGRLVEVPTRWVARGVGNGLAGWLHRGRQFLEVATTLGRLMR